MYRRIAGAIRPLVVLVGAGDCPSQKPPSSATFPDEGGFLLCSLAADCRNNHTRRDVL